MIPVLKPSCSPMEIDAVTNVLKSNWWGDGPQCQLLELRLSEIYGYKYCILTNSATAALHLSVLVNNIGPGDEVIVPALTFISTALAVTYTGATPVFADVRYDTLCIDYDDICRKITKRTKAIIPVDYAGYPASVRHPDLYVIQDAAHSCGGIGYGDFVCLSFHAVKNISGVEGGAILLNDHEKAERLRALRWCGIDKSTWIRNGKKYSWDYDIKEIGFKYNPNDVLASIALTQLDRRLELLTKRKIIANMYLDYLDGIVELPVRHQNHTWHLFPIRVDASKRNALIDYLATNGYTTGVHYKPLTIYPMYSGWKLPVTDIEWLKLISLPVFYDMNLDDVKIISNLIIDYIKG